jgi:hypothetical protein
MKSFTISCLDLAEPQLLHAEWSDDRNICIIGKVRNIQTLVRLEVFTAARIQVVVLWVVTPCGVAVGYQRFRHYTMS